MHADGNCVETDDGDIPLAPETVEMLACNCGVIDTSTADRDADRHVPRPLRRKVYARDGHRCRCCGSRHSLHVHHIIPWSQGGKTRRDNLITVCRWCHFLIHAGLPAEVDCAWWRRHAGLIRCNESAGTFELRPGRALDDDPADADRRAKVAQHGGRPIGVRRVAGLLGVPAATLERFHEPYLMRLGLISIVRGGRVAA